LFSTLKKKLLCYCKYVSVSGEDQPDKNVESALKSIAKGNKPWERGSNFGFKVSMKSRNGEFDWTIVARNSSDETPTLELYRSVSSDGKKFTKCIKIRYEHLVRKSK